ncbi:LysM peptidoglycan-binding domain-containing protein [Timonella sp. A28]|uniref:LysM peptidoglycan-binding domain-containing protein n=1 Tax=Timonella sp. A28 TaxID=3442640 RepID=UPI003EBF8905
MGSRNRFAPITIAFFCGLIWGLLFNRVHTHITTILTDEGLQAHPYLTYVEILILSAGLIACTWWGLSSLLLVLVQLTPKNSGLNLRLQTTIRTIAPHTLQKMLVGIVSTTLVFTPLAAQATQNSTSETAHSAQADQAIPAAAPAGVQSLGFIATPVTEADHIKNSASPTPLGFLSTELPSSQEEKEQPAQQPDTPHTPAQPVAHTPTHDDSATQLSLDFRAPDETNTPEQPHTTAQPQTKKEKKYTVKPGDSLWEIAATHTTSTSNQDIARSWNALYAANKEIIGNNPDMIFSGTVLTIPSALQSPHN